MSRARALHWLKHELLELLPVFIFFFVVFNVRNLTDTLVYGRAAGSPHAVWTLAVLALVVGKVMLLTDLLPFVNAFPSRPLIYNTLWKTFLYSLAALVYRIADHLLSLLRRYRGLEGALQQFWAGEDWRRFWGMQIWLAALLLLFVAAREVVLAIGGGQVLGKLFFGRRAA